MAPYGRIVMGRGLYGHEEMLSTVTNELQVTSTTKLGCCIILHLHSHWCLLSILGSEILWLANFNADFDLAIAILKLTVTCK